MGGGQGTETDCGRTHVVVRPGERELAGPGHGCPTFDNPEARVADLGGNTEVVVCGAVGDGECSVRTAQRQIAGDRCAGCAGAIHPMRHVTAEGQRARAGGGHAGAGKCSAVQVERAYRVAVGAECKYAAVAHGYRTVRECVRYAFDQGPGINRCGAGVGIRRTKRQQVAARLGQAAGSADECRSDAEITKTRHFSFDCAKRQQIRRGAAGNRVGGAGCGEDGPAGQGHGLGSAGSADGVGRTARKQHRVIGLRNVRTDGARDGEVHARHSGCRRVFGPQV